jgi:hypothetical protein
VAQRDWNVKSWDPTEVPRLWRGPIPPDPKCPVVFYTDGSTEPSTPKAPSGCSVVRTCASGTGVDSEHGFPVKTNGDNYVAETVALLAAVLSEDERAAVEVVTDSMSSMQAATKYTGVGGDGLRSGYAVPERRAVTPAARAVLRMYRSVAEQRSGPVVLRHVHSHTGGEDVDSRMNAEADRVAGAARVAADPGARGGEWGPHFAGETRLVLSFEGRPVHGRYKAAMLRHLADARVAKLRAEPGTSGGFQRVILAAEPRKATSLRALCKRVAKSCNAEAAKFVALALTDSLPTEFHLERVMLLKWKGRPHGSQRGESCKLCGALLETALHTLDGSCTHPRVAAACLRRDEEVRTMVERPYCPTLDGPALRRHAAGAPLRLQWPGRDLGPLMDSRLHATVNREILSAQGRIAPLLGVISPTLVDIVRFAREGPSQWVELGRDAADRRLRGASDAAFAGSVRVWQARCAAMDEWWDSEAAFKFRSAQAEKKAFDMSRGRMGSVSWNCGSRSSSRGLRLPREARSRMNIGAGMLPDVVSAHAIGGILAREELQAAGLCRLSWY